MAGRVKGTPKTGGRKAGTPNKRTVALRMATDLAAEKIEAALGDDAFTGDAHALLVSVYKDPRQPIGLRMEAAKAAIGYEKPRLAAIEMKEVDDLESLSTEELEAIAAGEAPLPAGKSASKGGGIGGERPPHGKPKLVTSR